MFKKLLMGLVCVSLVAIVGCGGGGGGSSHTPTQDIKEAIKGKWYLHSRDDLNFHTGDDDKVSYVEIKDNSIEATEYDWDENCVFGGESATITGTWKYENSILTVTWDNLGSKNYEVNLQNEILTLTYETLSGNMRVSANTVIDKFKKTKPDKYTAPAPANTGLSEEQYRFELLGGGSPLWLDLIRCQKGSFVREDSKTITISKDFAIGQFEVYQKQYQTIMKTNPSKHKSDGCPVENVTWNDAKAFCQKLNEKFADQLPAGYKFDLPTDDQWGYACRAGTTTDLNSGKNIVNQEGEDANTNEIAWYKYNSEGTTHEYGGKKGNAWGIYNMHGNVSEWCSNWFYDFLNYMPEENKPIYCGGNFNSDPLNCTSSSRHFAYTDIEYEYIGFRVALVPVE